MNTAEITLSLSLIDVLVKNNLYEELNNSINVIFVRHTSIDFLITILKALYPYKNKLPNYHMLLTNVHIEFIKRNESLELLKGL